VSRVRAAALFVFLGVLWGISFPAIEVGLESLPPVLFAAFRYDLAAALLLAYAAVTGDRGQFRPQTRADISGVLAGGVFLVAGNSLLFVGQQYTTGSVAAIIYSLIPVLTTLFAWLLLPGERLSTTGFAGVLLGLVGVGLVARPDPANLLAADVVGKGIVLAAAVSVAVGSVLVQRAEPTLGRVAFTGWAMLVGAVVLHVASVAVGESVTGVGPGGSALVALVYLGVFATALAFVIYFTLLRAHGPLRTNLVSYWVPVVATVVGALLLGETVTVLTVAGFVLIFGGFALLNRRQLGDLLARQRAWA